ncbi:MAG: hypothetical protein H7098_13720 [Oligoflexus sp.]|nr:hypothetical protein [Pseudopedobacter sp.]
MEKIIFILLPIAYFLYKAYLNFKKEQEKTAKRAAEQSQSLISNKEIIQKNKEAVPKYYKDPIRQENKDYESDIRKYLNKNKLELDTINKSASDVNKNNKASIKDYYNPEKPIVDVIKNKEIHLDHRHESEFVNNFKDDILDFDLKKAVIYDTILRRPNY